MTSPKNPDATRLALEWFDHLTLIDLLQSYVAGEFSWNEFWSYAVKLAERDGPQAVVNLLPAPMLRDFLEETEKLVGIAPDRLADLTLPPFRSVAIFGVIAGLLRQRLGQA